MPGAISLLQSRPAPCSAAARAFALQIAASRGIDMATAEPAAVRAAPDDDMFAPAPLVRESCVQGLPIIWYGY